jgi:hypothetical protein
MFKLLDEDDPVIEIGDDRRGVYAIAALAYCAMTNRLTSIETRLDALDNHGLSFSAFEFSYAVDILHLGQHDRSFSAQDRTLMARGLPQNCRTPILSIVIRSCSLLVRKATPDRIYRVVSSPDLPEKAFRKHDRMTKHLLDLGYEVTEQAVDPTGRKFWLMQREGIASGKRPSVQSYTSAHVVNGARPISREDVLVRLSTLKSSLTKQTARNGRRKAA